MEAEEFLMKEYDLKKEGLIIPAKNYFKVDMTLAELENLLIRYAKIKVSEISSSAVLAVSVCRCKEGKQGRTVDENWHQICDVCGGS